jgi:hypothetical protein
MSKTRLQLAAAVAAIGILAMPAAASAAQGPGAPKTPVPGVSALSGIACPTAKACVSVGSDDNFNGKSAVISAATGAVKVWSGDLANDSMNAVACPGTKSCVAVSDDAVASVAVSSGAMKVTATPKPPATGIVALGAIACAGTKACYAVGFEGTETASTATVVHLSPAGKLLATKQNNGKGIAAIACPSATLCLMGENYSSGLTIQLLNNGKFGKTQPLPANTYIASISCYKASACYALGGNSTSSPELTDELFPLNPATGAVGTMATIGGKFDGAQLSCLSATTCLAVGFTESGTGSTIKNAAVAIVSGKPGTPKNYPGNFGLRSVACASASSCYAVGASSSGAIADKVKS